MPARVVVNILREKLQRNPLSRTPLAQRASKREAKRGVAHVLLRHRADLMDQVHQGKQVHARYQDRPKRDPTPFVPALNPSTFALQSSSVRTFPFVS